MRCTAGALFGVAVDIRNGSPTYGQWVGETLTPDNGRQFWVPPGFAHGFCSLEPDTVICYKVTGITAPNATKGWLGMIQPSVSSGPMSPIRIRFHPKTANSRYYPNHRPISAGQTP